jgi:DNA-binding Xre family transcriptional regulator
MLTFNLLRVMQLRGIERPHYFLVKAGINRSMASRLLNNTSDSIPLKKMEMLCRVLICEPSDLFVFTPSEQHPLAADHPLNKLQSTTDLQAMRTAMSNLSVQELKQFAQQISGS